MDTQQDLAETGTNSQQDIGINMNKTTNKVADYDSILFAENIKPQILIENVTTRPPLPRPSHDTQGPTSSKLSGNVSNENCIKSIETSQLKMPKAYSSKKGVTKERVIDSRGRRSPFNSVKDKNNAKPPAMPRGKYKIDDFFS